MAKPLVTTLAAATGACAAPQRFGAFLADVWGTNLDMVAAAVHKSAHARLIAEPRAMASPPYNGARALSFLGPDGERAEVCETMWA
ncbi:MAG: hypothetical protein O3C65_09015 [Proteobacteria bacterium]|nr:hypothetical protein [Pseudomonadota bacterium]MDA1058813.1 hypothetical protein [Pseudomonadota bacterium]